MLVTSQKQFQASLLKSSSHLYPDACMAGPVEAEFAAFGAAGRGFLWSSALWTNIGLICMIQSPRSPLPPAPTSSRSSSGNHAFVAVNRN